MSLKINQKAIPVGRSRTRRAVNSAADIVAAFKERRQKICWMAATIVGLMAVVFGSMTLITNMAKFNPKANSKNVAESNASDDETNYIAVTSDDKTADDTEETSTDDAATTKTETTDTDVTYATTSSASANTVRQTTASQQTVGSTNGTVKRSSNNGNESDNTAQPKVDSNQEETVHVDWCEQNLPQAYGNYRASVERQEQEYRDNEIGAELYQQNVAALWTQFIAEANAHGCSTSFYTE